MQRKRKYRRFSNYHAYTAKLREITPFVATVALFGCATKEIAIRSRLTPYVLG